MITQCITSRGRQVQIIFLLESEVSLLLLSGHVVFFKSQNEICYWQTMILLTCYINMLESHQHRIEGSNKIYGRKNQTLQA